MLNNTSVTFAGNLAADPQLSFTPTGKAVAEFRVIVNRRAKNEAGEWLDKTPTTHNCTVWGKPAENLTNSASTGTRVIVNGTVRTDTWTDKESGTARYRDVVEVAEVGLSLAWTAARVDD